MVLRRVEDEAVPLHPRTGPEVVKLPERVLGRYETIALPPDAYVVMPQVRNNKNLVGLELEKSIEQKGLINPIDVARMNEDALTDYVDFVSDIWHADVSMDDFYSLKQADDNYYLVIAGHSRRLAVKQLVDQGKYPSDILMEAKIHQVASPADIIELQLAENIHSQPPRERAAMAIVESYEWGLRQGLWRGQADYLRQHGEVGRSALSDALGFANLPSHVRHFVLGGRMSYTAGVELGRSFDAVQNYAAMKLQLDPETMSQEQQQQFEDYVEREIAIQANMIVRDNLNSTAAEKKVRAWRQQLAGLVETKDHDSEATLFDLDLKTPAELRHEEIVRQRQAMMKLLRSFSSTPNTVALEMLQLNRSLVDSEEYQRLLADFDTSVVRASHNLGSQAVVSLVERQR